MDEKCVIPAAQNWPQRAAAGIVGAYFLTAAGLKLFSGGAVTVSGGGYTPALQLLAVQVELVLGAWLILDRMPVAAWLSACLLLATLAGISFTSALRGQSDCGCFGQFKVHPGITTAINLAVLGLLLLCRPPVKWPENRGTLAAVGVLAVAAGGLAWTANGPLGDKLLAKWQGRTVALRSSVIDAGEGTVGMTKQLPVIVTNASSRDIRLIGGGASCSCTTTQNLPTIVPAGSEVAVQIELTFRGTPGKFEHRFEFFSDDKKQPKLYWVIVGQVADRLP